MKRNILYRIIDRKNGEIAGYSAAVSRDQAINNFIWRTGYFCDDRLTRFAAIPDAEPVKPTAADLETLAEDRAEKQQLEFDATRIVPSFGGCCIPFGDKPVRQRRTKTRLSLEAATVTR